MNTGNHASSPCHTLHKWHKSVVAINWKRLASVEVIRNYFIGTLPFELILKRLIVFSRWR